MIRIQNLKRVAASLALASMLATPVAALASSHREAPGTALDNAIDNTDVYAFVSPDRPDTVTLLSNVQGAQIPGAGPNYFRFDENALYSIHVDNDGDALPDITYNFEFEDRIKNGNTFLYATGPIDNFADVDYNFQQSYTITKVDHDSGETKKLHGGELTTPPNNVGSAATPNYANLAEQATYGLFDGLQGFAGQRGDAFFIDLGDTFDLLQYRDPGVDTLKNFNVLTIALQVPFNQITNGNVYPTDQEDPAAVIGVWSTVSRRETTVIKDDGTREATGDWKQVSRLGFPLVNELLIPLRLKDKFNASKPKDDGQFAEFVLDPEPSRLLNALFGVNVPPAPRSDIAAIALTGVRLPNGSGETVNLNQPANAVPSEQLRLNLGIPPTPKAQQSRLGVLGGDLAGFPNGRRLTDDVVDIVVRVAAGATYNLIDPNFQIDNFALTFEDGVDHDDQPVLSKFPYAPLPAAGSDAIEAVSRLGDDGNGGDDGGNNCPDPGDIGGDDDGGDDGGDDDNQVCFDILDDEDNQTFLQRLNNHINAIFEAIFGSGF